VGGGGENMSDYNDLPDWTLPYISENFTGPYVSDGKFQESVAKSTAKPKSKLDWHSRTHDSAYAVRKDRKSRYEADLVYQANAYKIGGIVPRVAGTAVRYLNQLGDGRTLRDTVGNLRGAVKDGGVREPRLGRRGGGGVKTSKIDMDETSNPLAKWDVNPNESVYLPAPYFRGAVPKKVTQPAEPVLDPYDNDVVKPGFKYEKAKTFPSRPVEAGPHYHVNFRYKTRRRRRKYM